MFRRRSKKPRCKRCQNYFQYKKPSLWRPDTHFKFSREVKALVKFMMMVRANESSTARVFPKDIWFIIIGHYIDRCGVSKPRTWNEKEFCDPCLLKTINGNPCNNCFSQRKLSWNTSPDVEFQWKNDKAVEKIRLCLRCQNVIWVCFTCGSLKPILYCSNCCPEIKSYKEIIKDLTKDLLEA